MSEPLVDSEGRVLTAWKPTVRQMRKLIRFIHQGPLGELPTHVCAECACRYILPESTIEEIRTLTCKCGAETLLDLAEELANMYIQKQLDDIFDKD